MSSNAPWIGRQEQRWRPALLLMTFAAVIALVATVWLAFKIYQATGQQQPRFPYVPWLAFSIASLVISIGTALSLWLSHKYAESEQTLASAEKANFLGWLALQAFVVAAALGLAPVILEYSLSPVDNWFTRVNNRGLQAWREWPTWKPIVFTVGGLLGMMLAFSFMVNEARENPFVRRLIYGYNTFVSAVLLLGILIVVNGIAFAYGTRPFDWTSTGTYTVHERMQNLLRRLDKPVHVYVLIDPEDSLYPEMRNYLDLCQTYNREKFRVHYPFLRGSRELLQQLFQRYRVSFDQAGILVVYDPDDRNAYQFIRRDDLRSESRFGREPPVFKGESSLASALVTLMQGPEKPAIYFTTGAGEMTAGHADKDRNLLRLKDRLEQQGYRVKEVDLTKRDASGGPATEVLQALLEAEVLIVADPLSAPPGYVEMLKLYMGSPAPLGLPQSLGLVSAALQGPLFLFDHSAMDWFMIQQVRRGKGRLMVFTGAHLENRAPTACPLEAMLKDYGVAVGRDVVFSLVRGQRLNAFVRINPRADDRLRAGLSPSQLETVFPILLCRSLDSGQGGDYVVTPLLQTFFPIYLLQDRLLADDPEKHLLEHRDRDFEGFEQRIKNPPQTVAVTVRERSSRVPRDPFHAGVAGEGTPRLVVFGSAWLAILAGFEDFHFNLIASSLAWLRDRPELIDVGIPPRDKKSFEPGPNFQQYSLLSFMVQGLMVFGLVIVSGIGVYLVRRHQ